jgi:hypothetical protein
LLPKVFMICPREPHLCAVVFTESKTEN